ncbi:MAG: hypothetical protein ABI779_14155, partial [Acidobacteriota bacterium]
LAGETPTGQPARTPALQCAACTSSRRTKKREASTTERCAYRATTALLEISEHVFRKRIVKVVWDDKRSGRQAEWPRTTDALDRSNLRHWPIVGGHHESFAVEDAVENALRISLHLFYRHAHWRQSNNVAYHVPMSRKCHGIRHL